MIHTLYYRQTFISAAFFAGDILSPFSWISCPLGSLPLSKDRNGMDLTKAEDINKRWQEYTEELHKKRSSQPRKP